MSSVACGGYLRPAPLPKPTKLPPWTAAGVPLWRASWLGFDEGGHAAAHQVSRDAAMRVDHDEKNWLPFVVDGVLHVLYWLCPEQVVLRCDASGGRCDEVARHIGLQACLDLGTSQEVHGGAPPVRRSVSDAVVEHDAVLLPPLSYAWGRHTALLEAVPATPLRCASSCWARGCCSAPCTGGTS